MPGSLLRAGVVFLLTTAIVGVPGGFLWLGAWLKAGDTGTPVALSPATQAALLVALVAGVPAAAVSLRRRLRLRPADSIDARHACPSSALLLVGSDENEYVFAVRNPAYGRELALIPGIREDIGAVLKERRQVTFLRVLLLVIGLVATAMGIYGAWHKIGR